MKSRNRAALTISIPLAAPSATLEARFRRVLPRAIAQEKELAAERDNLLLYLARAEGSSGNDEGECRRAREGVVRIEVQMVELRSALERLLGMREVSVMICDDAGRAGRGGV